MIKVKKKKWLDFPKTGIQCYDCGGDAIYESCTLHEDFYPTLTDRNLIRVPNCSRCKIFCHKCNRHFEPSIYLIKKETNKVIERPKKKKEPEIKYSFKDKLYKADLSHIKDLETYKRATKGSLNLIFSFDVGTQLAIDEVEKAISDIGLEINFSSLKGVNDRLSRLLYALLMVRASGLSSYEKPIIEAEIEKAYGHNVSESKKDALLEILRTQIINKKPKD